MSDPKFISVGENIHCTRIYKVDGKYVTADNNGKYTIKYTAGDGKRELAVPKVFRENADWQAGKIKHCAAAIWCGNYGSQEEQSAGKDYIRCSAMRQEQAGATYLDINVDEFSTDVEERVELIKWTVGVVQEAVSCPVSVDSSNTEILRAGLSVCDASQGSPMVNSVSLERIDAVELAAEYNAVVIASAAGKKDLPSSCEEKLSNISAIMNKLREAGFSDDRIHVDPLVFPISTNGSNGKDFLDTVKEVRNTYGSDIHIVAGLSNVSFGMPNRKLINRVFARLAVDAGADGGIVDPMQINGEVLNSMDRESKQFKLAQDLLLGEDEFGMNYITASRNGEL